MKPVKIDVLAGLFGVSERQARNLLQEAGVRPVSRGEWDLVRSVRGVFTRLREARQSTELSRARARQVDAAAKKTELATRRAERELVPLEDAQAALDLMMGKMVAEFSGFSARVTRDLELRRRLDREIFEMRKRMDAATTTGADFLQKGGELPYDFHL